MNLSIPFFYLVNANVRMYVSLISDVSFEAAALRQQNLMFIAIQESLMHSQRSCLKMKQMSYQVNGIPVQFEHYNLCNFF